MINFLAIIQARVGSTRFPGKVFQTIQGKSLVKRVWEAAKGSWADKVVMAWPERYADLDENNVRERFRRISSEFPSKYIIRLTADCPLLTSRDINEAIMEFNNNGKIYYCNRDKKPDGYDVQIFTRFMLFGDYATNQEHVIIPDKFTTPENYHSVNTKEDLERVRAYVR